MKTFITSALCVAALAASPLAGHADDTPPRGALPLVDVVKNLEKAGYQPIGDASFEGKTWEVEARREGVKRELHVNPESGEVISDRSDD